MNETVIRIGRDRRLVGVLSAPERAAERPAVLFLNAGVVHRVGPHRLHVRIARRLAGAGIASLRLDLSGLGDSPPARRALGFERQAVEDVAAGVDALSEIVGARGVVALGMCSGADLAYGAGLSDNRLSGLILLDPYAYEAPGAKIGQLTQRAANPDRWIRKLKKLAAAEPADVAEDFDDRGVPAPAIDDDRDPPPRDEFARGLASLTARGCAILIRYTSYVSGKIQAPEQFYRTFADVEFGPFLSVDVNGDVDHTYTEQKAQADLTEHIVSWFEARWPGGA